MCRICRAPPSDDINRSPGCRRPHRVRRPAVRRRAGLLHFPPVRRAGPSVHRRRHRAEVLDHRTGFRYDTVTSSFTVVVNDDAPAQSGKSKPLRSTRTTRRFQSALSLVDWGSLGTSRSMVTPVAGTVPVSPAQPPHQPRRRRPRCVHLVGETSAETLLATSVERRRPQSMAMSSTTRAGSTS